MILLNKKKKKKNNNDCLEMSLKKHTDGHVMPIKKHPSKRKKKKQVYHRLATSKIFSLLRNSQKPSMDKNNNHPGLASVIVYDTTTIPLDDRMNVNFRIEKRAFDSPFGSTPP